MTDSDTASSLAPTTLAGLHPGDQGRIVGLSGRNPAFRKRLLSMGLIPGTPFKVLRIAPLGDPVEILVRGFKMCLRKTEASLLAIEV